MKTIAVTGSSGFIGKHLVKALNEKAYSVVPLDYDNGYDLMKKEDVARIPKFNTIVHLAAKSFVPQSFESPYDFYLHNYITTLNILERARISKAKVIFFSSYLYGHPDYLPVDENHPLKPHNPYAESKLICEKLCEGYARDFDVPVIIFRPFNIYGTGQNSSFLIPMIIEQLKSGNIQLKDSRPRRDFIYIQDVVSAVMLAIEANSIGFDIFNLGSGQSYSIEELINILTKSSKIPVKVNFSNESRKGEVLETVACTNKIKLLLNWNAKTTLNDGIKTILDL